MSLSSIMTHSEPHPPAAPPPPPPPVVESRKSSKSALPPIKAEPGASDAVSPPTFPDVPIYDAAPVAPQHELPVPSAPAPARHLPVVHEHIVEAELAHIEAMDTSDVDGASFEADKHEHMQRSRKRAADIDQAEKAKRKVCIPPPPFCLLTVQRRRTAYAQRFLDVFAAHREHGKHAYYALHEKDAWKQVQDQEIAEEKERKKDMQRKRRRERTLLNEEAKRAEALAKAGQAETEADKVKHLREAERAEKKAKTTTQLLQGGVPVKDVAEAAPHPPNFDGGTMGSFQTADEPRDAAKKRGTRSGARPKKSKEQKQAEKDAAAAGQAALDRGDELPPAAAKNDAHADAAHSRSPTADTPGAATAMAAAAYLSPAYHALYVTIWKDMARKDVPKVLRIREASMSTKQSNLRKTVQLASKEARRWQMRTNKSTKDIQARGKRSMREMLSFWKRNEREERDLRKRCGKAGARQRQEAPRRTARRNRQKRKLNFLMLPDRALLAFHRQEGASTDEVERSTDDARTSALAARRPYRPARTMSDASSIAPDAHAESRHAKVTNFEDLDFDAEDEIGASQAAAMANAQAAVQEAQDKRPHL